MECTNCGNPVSAGAYRKTVGWTKGRAAGGKNQVALPEYEDEYMCDSCMAVAKSGVAPGQGKLA